MSSEKRVGEEYSFLSEYDRKGQVDGRKDLEIKEVMKDDSRS